MTTPLARRIRAAREAAGDTATLAADKIGISRQGYNKWETGDTANMRLDHLCRFCDAYHVPLDLMVRAAMHGSSESPITYAIEPLGTGLPTNDSASEERELIDGYRDANQGTREDLLSIARRATRDKARRSSSTESP